MVAGLETTWSSFEACQKHLLFFVIPLKLSNGHGRISFLPPIAPRLVCSRRRSMHPTPPLSLLPASLPTLPPTARLSHSPTRKPTSSPTTKPTTPVIPTVCNIGVIFLWLPYLLLRCYGEYLTSMFFYSLSKCTFGSSSATCDQGQFSSLVNLANSANLPSTFTQPPTRSLAPNYYFVPSR